MTEALPPQARAIRNFRHDDAELRRMSEWFREFARSTGFPPDRALDFELCLNELLANTIRHGRDGAKRDVRITLEQDAPSMRATIEDDGPFFDPSTAADRPSNQTLETMRPGGWGIPIVHAFANEIRYERRDGWNRVTIAMIASNP